MGDDPVKLRDEIQKTTNFVGIAGVFNDSPVNHDGLHNEGYMMVEVVNGKWTFLKKKCPSCRRRLELLE